MFTIALSWVVSVFLSPRAQGMSVGTGHFHELGIFISDWVAGGQIILPLLSSVFYRFLIPAELRKQGYPELAGDDSSFTFIKLAAAL